MTASWCWYHDDQVSHMVLYFAGARGPLAALSYPGAWYGLQYRNLVPLIWRLSPRIFLLYITPADHLAVIDKGCRRRVRFTSNIYIKLLKRQQTSMSRSAIPANKNDMQFGPGNPDQSNPLPKVEIKSQCLFRYPQPRINTSSISTSQHLNISASSQTLTSTPPHNSHLLKQASTTFPPRCQSAS